MVRVKVTKIKIEKLTHPIYFLKLIAYILVVLVD